MRKFHRRKKLIMICSIIGVAATVAMADTIDFTFDNTLGDGKIIVGDYVNFYAVDNGTFPSPISNDLAVRSVDDGVIGSWSGCAPSQPFAFAGEYEVLMTCIYMPDPGAPPDKPIGPKKVSVAPPDDIVIDTPNAWQNNNAMPINTDNPIKFKILAKGKPAGLDASTVAEEKIREFSLIPTAFSFELA